MEEDTVPSQMGLDGHPSVEPGMLMFDVYPSGEGNIVIRVYTGVEPGQEPIILQRLLAAQDSGRYLTSVGSEFPKAMRMLQKLSAVVSESTGGNVIVKGICRNQSRPDEYSICFIVR